MTGFGNPAPGGPGTGVAKPRTPGQGPRPIDDFYPTPRGATRALCRAGELDDDPHIWEPACGDGRIAGVLAEEGHEVEATDLVDRGYGKGGADYDFLMQYDLLAPVIVTNPPYENRKGLLMDFVNRALSLRPRKLVMFLPLGFLSSLHRRQVIEELGLARIYVFANRVSLWPNGVKPVRDDGKEPAGTTVIYAWFVWEDGYDGSPMIVTPRLIYKMEADDPDFATRRRVVVAFDDRDALPSEMQPGAFEITVEGVDGG